MPWSTLIDVLNSEERTFYQLPSMGQGLRVKPAAFPYRKSQLI
ncbi:MULTISPECIES: hypothetical protein [Shewanella]|nr:MULTISPECIES: hypothetical protein [Shewanella]